MTLAPRLRTPLLAVAVALVLADSSVVTLALPDILRRYDASIDAIARVLTFYNGALALVAIPAGLLARGRARACAAVGAVGLAAASVVCAAAPTLDWLLAGRVGQAVAGALLAVAALELLAGSTGSRGGAAGVWTAAGVAGAALGPAVGGVLTQVLGWESIFAAQAPIALVALLALAGPIGERERRRDRPNLVASVAVGLLSAALTGALFLLVLLLVEGWRHPPLLAALVVSVMPVCAVGARLVRSEAIVTTATTGAILIAGGLAALAVLPHAGPLWTVAPQVLVGVGLGLTITALTTTMLDGRAPQVLHGGVSLAARHAGVVVGLVLLAPVFTADLDRQSDDALRAGAAILLDSRVSPGTKLALAGDVIDAVDAARGRLPDIEPAFAGRSGSEIEAVRAGLHDQLDRAATHAFSRSFLFASALALAGAATIALGRRRLE